MIYTRDDFPVGQICKLTENSGLQYDLIVVAHRSIGEMIILKTLDERQIQFGLYPTTRGLIPIK